ncbi:Asp23/Gls24 family envelope stress response protein [Saccharomonospora sp. NB11]|jgi:uncharacterized alkaline shock family protein YloU|uniref:Asp23/Gls24 family envelope stress response protein n=1 Tax=Saccharomonospora sp. NB11 TaxID=1642298 RepID=UPI0018D1384B|nr:Asp23/Gls24 family envelope stress response protein [Saccharomonospora sp. NB11]
MTAFAVVALVDGVDVDAVAAAVRACDGVAGLESGTSTPAQAPTVSYLPGRTVPGVRVEPDRVTVQVVAQWGVPVPELGRRIQAAVAPYAAGRRVDVIVADLVDAPVGRADLDCES